MICCVFSVYSVTINPEQATLGHVNWGVIYDDFNHEIPLFNLSLNCHVFYERNFTRMNFLVSC